MVWIVALGLMAAPAQAGLPTEAPIPSSMPLSPTPTIEHIEIVVGDLRFDALAAGPESGDLVLLLHGFPQTGHSYRAQIAALAEAGYRAVAPDQRGYSPGARPTRVEDYVMGNLVADAVGMVDALGYERFHLVGHDWGGAVAWVVATRFPGRVRTLTVLSTPHFGALGAGLSDPDSEQSQRSSYFDTFAAEGSEALFLADDKAFFRSILEGVEIPEADLNVYLERLGTPEAMRAALNWYSALVAGRTGATGGASPPPPPIQMPTLYVWGSEDVAFAREAAEATREFVAGPYSFHALEGRGHWLPEEAAETVTRLILEHLSS